MCNRTNLPNTNFKGIVSSVLIFWCKHSKVFRFLEDYYRDIKCEIRNVSIFPWFF